MVTNGAVTGPARNFAKEQKLHVVDRFLLEDWIENDRPVWELLGTAPRARTATAALAQNSVTGELPSSGLEITDRQPEPLYTLVAAYEAGFVPWKPPTVRQYLLRSQRRGIPLPRSSWDGQAHHYTEAELRSWLKNWRAQSGPNNKAQELRPE